MRITDIQERSVPISRYADPAVPSGGLTTSTVAVTTYIVREGKPVVGYASPLLVALPRAGLLKCTAAPSSASHTSRSRSCRPPAEPSR
jgi:D(-)-tartrate dehydratase